MKPGTKKKIRDASEKVRTTSEKEILRKFLTGRLQVAEKKLSSEYVQGHTMKKLSLQASISDYKKRLADLDPKVQATKTGRVDCSVENLSNTPKVA